MKKLFLIFLIALIAFSCKKNQIQSLDEKKIEFKKEELVKLEEMVLSSLNFLETSKNNGQFSNVSFVSKSNIDFQNYVTINETSLKFKIKNTDNKFLFVSFNLNEDIMYDLHFETQEKKSDTVVVYKENIFNSFFERDKYFNNRLVETSKVESKILDPNIKVDSYCTDWYLVNYVNGVQVSETYLYTSCSDDTCVKLLPNTIFEDPNAIKISIQTLKSDCAGGGSTQVNKNLKPCNFNFQESFGAEWQAAGVKDITIVLFPDGILKFNIEVGMPRYSIALGRTISREEAQNLSSAAYSSSINIANYEYSIGQLTRPGIPNRIAALMQQHINLALGFNLSRVSNILGTNPGAPVKFADFNIQC